MPGLLAGAWSCAGVMGTQRRIDLRGILQLAGAAVLFAVVAVYVVSLTKSLGPLAIVLVGFTAAAAGVFVQYWEWKRLGGRASVVMTDEWIRGGEIPLSVPREVWVPLLVKRETRAVRNWWSLVAGALQILLAVVSIMTPRSTADHAFWLCVVVFWTGIIAWTVYYNLRWLPEIRRLLRQISTAEVTPAAASQIAPGAA